MIGLVAFAQQDPVYNLYMFNPLGVNPGYAGSREVLSGVLIHRSQWVGLDGAPTTQALAINSPMKNKKMGLGLQVVNDQIGPRNTMTATAVYAYRLKLGQGKLAFGLRGGIQNYSYDWTKIEYKQQNDQLINNATGSFIIPTFDFGMYYNTNTMYAGIAMEHLNRAQYNISGNSSAESPARVYSHINATVGKAFMLNSNVVLKSSLLIRTDEQANGTVDVNVGCLFNQRLYLGVTGTTRETIIAIAEFNLSKNFRAGYAYDYTFSDLTQSTGAGSHEIFIGYDLSLFKSKVISPRYF